MSENAHTSAARDEYLQLLGGRLLVIYFNIKPVPFKDWEMRDDGALLCSGHLECTWTDERLLVDFCRLLELLESVLLIARVLIENEQVVPQPSNDEPQVKLPHNLEEERFEWARILAKAQM